MSGAFLERLRINQARLTSELNHSTTLLFADPAVRVAWWRDGSRRTLVWAVAAGHQRRCYQVRTI